MPPVSAPSRRRAAVAPLDPLRFSPTRGRPVRAKLRRLAPDTQIQPHSHAWAQVAISIAGVARITAGRHTYLVPGWRAVWIPPGVEHVVTALEAAELRTLYIHQEPDRPGPAVARRDCEPWRGCRVLEVSPLLRELVLQMDVTMDGQAPLGAPALEREARLGELVLDELRRAAPLRLGIELPQDRRLRALCEATEASGHELLLEIIPPRGLPRAPDTLLRAMKRLYNLGCRPEWWKLEAMGAAEWRAIDALVAERDPYCRGVLVLGQAADVATLAQGFRDARDSATCRGFAVGRTIFEAPARAWLAGEIDDPRLKAGLRETFEALIDAWNDARRGRREAA